MAAARAALALRVPGSLSRLSGATDSFVVGKLNQVSAALTLPSQVSRCTSYADTRWLCRPIHFSRVAGGAVALGVASPKACVRRLLEGSELSCQDPQASSEAIKGRRRCAGSSGACLDGGRRQVLVRVQRTAFDGTLHDPNPTVRPHALPLRTRAQVRCHRRRTEAQRQTGARCNLHTQGWSLSV